MRARSRAITKAPRASPTTPPIGRSSTTSLIPRPPSGKSSAGLSTSPPLRSKTPGVAGQHILALDQGTTSSRAIVFDIHGQIQSVAQKEFPQIFPRAGWVEHDANDIWQSQVATAREALSKASLSAGDIAAIGIANQRETTVIWDRRSGQPIANAIVWQD